MIKFIAQVKQGWQVHSQIETFQFPAGEIHLKNTDTEEVPVAIYLTGTDLNDYMAGAMWADYCHQNGHEAIALIPYLPAARADRGIPFGAKVYANMINAAGYDKVICFDPHSEVITTLVNNLVVVDSAEVIARTLNHQNDSSDYVGVICPDQGAHARTEKVAKELGLPVFYAEKHRDFETGKLSGFSCEPLPEEGRLLVVDDICDGGGTFMGLAAAINIPRDRLSLWVSHGVFSGRANQLKESYGEILTTDSFPNAGREDVGAKIIPLLADLLVAAKNQH